MFFLNTRSAQRDAWHFKNFTNLTNLFLYSSRIRELENFWSSERNQACLNCRVVTKVCVANYFCVGDERDVAPTGLGGPVVCHSENIFSRWPAAESPTANSLSCEPIPFSECGDIIRLIRLISCSKKIMSWIHVKWYLIFYGNDIGVDLQTP